MTTSEKLYNELLALFGKKATIINTRGNTKEITINNMVEYGED